MHIYAMQIFFIFSGIMNYGRLRCLGSQTRLKAKFGEGYQLKFHCMPGKIRQVERYVQANVATAKHMETYAGKKEVLTD